MKTELFIYIDEWKQLDLMDDINIPLTFNIADISDISKRNANYSKTINLPGSKTNNSVLEHLCDLTTFAQEVHLDKKFPVYITYNSQEIFNGIIEINKIVKSNSKKVINYEAIVYSDTGDFFNKIKDKLLKGNENTADDLDFSDYDHILNVQNVFLSWFKPVTGTGYVYAPIDKTNHWDMPFPNNTNFFLDEVTPHLFIKEIFDKIINGAGFTYDSDFLNSERFKRCVYPHTDRWLKLDDETVARNSSYVDGDGNYAEVSVVPADVPGVISRAASGNYHGELESQGTNNCYDDVTGEFTCVEGGTYRVNLAFDYSFSLYTEDGPGPNFVISEGLPPKTRKWKGSINLCKYQAATNATHIVETLSSYEQGCNAKLAFIGNKHNLVYDRVKYSIDDLILAPGDKLFIKINLELWCQRPIGSDYIWEFGGNPIDMSLKFYTYDATFDTEIWYEMNEVVVEGSLVPMTQILHKKIKQGEFISTINKMFNLYWELTGNKHFRIETRDDFYLLDTVPVDWTNKVALDLETEIESAAELRTSNILMSYDKDSDYFNQGYTDATGKIYGEADIKIDEAIKDFNVKLIFAPTPGGNLGQDSKLQIPKIFSLKNNGEINEDKEYKPRILYWAGLVSPDDASNWTLSIRTQGAWQTFPKWPAVGHFDKYFGEDEFDLNFESCNWYWYDLKGTWSTWNNLYNLYYKNYIDELLDPNTRLVTMKLLLNQHDIQNLKFYKPIFIDGVYYRLNKIIDWVPNEITSVELISLNKQKITFTGKKPKPNIVAAINYINVSYNQNFLALLDAAREKKSVEFNVDLFDPNLDVADLVYVIDGSDGRGDVAKTYGDPNTNILLGTQFASLQLDLVEVTDRLINSINEMKSGAVKIARSVGKNRNERKHIIFRR